MAYKPDSVQGLPLWMIIPLHTPLPARVKLPTRTSGLKRPCGRYRLPDQPRARSLFGIAPGGACHAGPVARSAVRSYRTFSPFPARRPVVCFLWRFPSGFPGRALPGTFASWSPDFPRTLQSAIIQPSAHCWHLGAKRFGVNGEAFSEIANQCSVNRIFVSFSPWPKPQAKSR